MQMKVSSPFTKNQIWMQCLIFFAVGVIFSIFALISRTHRELGKLNFLGYWVHENLGSRPDLVEHFIFGFSTPLIVGAFGIMFLHFLAPSMDESGKPVPIFLKQLHSWTCIATSQRDSFLVGAIGFTMVLVASLDWEFSQRQRAMSLGVARDLQIDQVAADHAGAIFSVVLIVILNRYWYKRIDC